MSATSTPNDSPIQPLHNPSQAAQIVVPQAPLGSVANQAPGMGAKALLAKKMAKTHNPAFISPTDNLMTPVTQKLNAAKKKHFNKSTKPVQLFSPARENDQSSDDDDEDSAEKAPSSDPTATAAAPTTTSSKIAMQVDDDENPF
ncbi:hypothetical protein JR316_0005167 [Psilocybe cubensis]|uniref:Uncharacterized protein n=2 Tax=Psilocybe cubensis TaxID=181762 RepID=A0ACB8H5U5_PSICU|nr:hypothetical protein JR316_0005167 [Psilocybe cubensis]KAH9483067.1 hypothetical protein JR316_0005167 [Psilocybe cubensis]